MPGHDIIVVGASAGGVEALMRMVEHLPADLPAAVFVVLHMPSDRNSVLPTILTRSGPLPAKHPRDGERIEPRMIYVAPPDHHLLVRRGHVRVVRGPRENGHRPAIDPLFRTAAEAYGARVVGVVLSGTLDDGTAGLAAVKRQGGVAIVQEPSDALYGGMPQSALEAVAVDACLTAREMGARLACWAREPVGDAGVPAVPEEMDQEGAMAELDAAALQQPERPGTLAALSCPECHGTLWEQSEGELLRFRCRVGHAYSADSLLLAQSGALENAFWVALRTLEEKAALARRLADRASERGHTLAEARFVEQEAEARRGAEVVRQVLLGDAGLADAASGAD